MQLEHLLTFTVVIGENTPIGVGPYGNRAVAAVAGGTFEGPSTARDHPTARRRLGAGRLQQPPRPHRRTPHLQDRRWRDIIYVTYTGVIELNEAIATGAGSRKGETQFGDNYLASRPDATSKR